jgi:WD40 repeat protein/serine/threonine protein kinase
LPPQDDPRLARALEEYQAALEAGTRLNRHELLARYPDIAEKLAECLEGLEFVHTVAPQLQEPALAPGTSAAGVRPELSLGDYRIIREVGRGGMGVVYEAEQRSLGRRVALKVLLGPAAQDPRLLSRFRRESRAAAQLHHTNIVPVYEVGQQGDLCYYAMQFIHGQALDEVFRELQHLRAGSVPDAAKEPATLVYPLAQSLWTGEFKPDGSASGTIDHEPGSAPAVPRPAELSAAALPDRSELSSVASNFRRYCRNVARLGLQAAEALAYAHGRGIIHRDIKPANLLRDSTGVLWVSDFGLVKTQDPALTDTGDLVGTLRYMAPERFRGECDARADVYALGLTLYELLVLRPAFDGQDRLHLVDQIGRLEPARLRTLDPRIPRDLETILMKAIEKDPRRRYPSAQALAGDLRRFLADEPIQARRIGPVERLGRWGRRNPVVAGLSAAVVVVAALGFAGVLGQWQAAVALELEAKENARQAQKNEQDANRERDDARQQRDEARALAEQLRRTTYLADMNVAQHAWEATNVGWVRDLLEQHRPKPGETDLRGFEWHYLYRLCHSDVLTLQGPTDGFTSVAYSPDGKRLAAGSRAAALGASDVKVWDAQTGQELLTLKGHTGGVWSLAFSSDGLRLASASYDSTVKVWDARTGKELVTCKGHVRQVKCVAFSPDGKRLASAGGGNDQMVKVWDAQTGEELFTRTHNGWVSGVAFSPDGKRLASTAGGNDQTVKVWDAQTGQELFSLKGGGHGVAFSPDGKRLASGTVNTWVKVWDAETRQELFTFKGNAGQVWNLAFSPDSQRLASACQDRMVTVWDVRNGQEIFALKGHSAFVWSVAYSPDGKHLASASQDGTVKVWDAQPGPQPLTRQLRISTGVMVYSGPRVAFGPDGKCLASAATGTRVRVWDVRTGQEILSLPRHTGQVTTVGFSPDGKLLARALDRTVKVWDAQTGQELVTLEGHTNSIWSVAFSPDGKRLVSGSGEGIGVGQSSGDTTKGEVIVWDVETGKELLTLKGISRCVTFSPDGKYLASGSGLWATLGEVKVWNAQTGKELFTSKGHTDAVNSVAFSPDSKRLASASQDTTVKVWDAQTGGELVSLKGHTDPVNDVAFSPDGKRLASASGSSGNGRGELKVWDAQAGRELLSLKGKIGPVVSVAFSPDGHQLACGATGGTVTSWDATPLPAKP